MKLDQQTLGFSSFMEKITHARVKDCFIDDGTVYFVVAAGQMGKALGKGASNIKKISEKLKKPVRVIEFANSAPKFAANVVYPIKVEQIVLEENVLIFKDSARKTKSLLIGRSGQNLERIKRAITRFFDVEIKIE